MTDSTIVKTVFLQADAERVWTFLTNKDKLGEWFFTAEADLEEGAAYVLVEEGDDGTRVRKCWGSVLESVHAKKLVYTFTFDPLGGELTTVTWELLEVLGGTRLMLTHDGIGEAAGEAALSLTMALDGGWDRHLAGLRAAAL